MAFNSADVIDAITAANTFDIVRNNGRLPECTRTPTTGQYSCYLDNPDVASPNSAMSLDKVSMESFGKEARAKIGL